MGTTESAGVIFILLTSSLSVVRCEGRFRSSLQGDQDRPSFQGTPLGVLHHAHARISGRY
jgi:hypothetical protein